MKYLGLQGALIAVFVITVLKNLIIIAHGWVRVLEREITSLNYCFNFFNTFISINFILFIFHLFFFRFN